MRRIMIPTLTQPGVPNANNVVYTKQVWNEFMASIEYPIPVTIENNEEWHKTGIPENKIIGHASLVADKYIIVDLLESKYENDKLASTVMNKVINMINEGEVKAYMNYMVDINHEPDMAHIYVDKIYKIINFHLGRSNPKDGRPIEVSIAPHKKKHEGRKHERC